MKIPMFRFIVVFLVVACGWPLTGPSAQSLKEAPGRPGMKSNWSSGHKTGVGTSAGAHSKVWYTLDQGQLTEVFYPRLDSPNLRNLDFIVTDGKGYLRLESRHADRRETTWTDKSSLAFSQTTGDAGRWELTKTYTTDPNRQTLLVNVSFKPLDKRVYQVYALIDPSVGNSGMHDTGYNDGKALISSDGKISMAVAAKPPFRAVSTGFAGVSDGWTDMREDGKLDLLDARATDGNIVQIGQLGDYNSTLALGFGEAPKAALEQAESSLKEGFVAVKKAYDVEWNAYVKRLPAVAPEFRDTFVMAAMTLKSHEDKTYRGATVAGISVPWGETADADEPTGGGYHLVWSRDLYQVATAWLALGDRDAAGRALDYLFDVQQRPDGSYPQNTWLDGRPYWPSIQLDEVAYPIILAWHLERFDDNTYRKHVRPSAEFLVKNGPETEQERWEEEKGFSPSTIAAEIAGLVCAADIAKKLKKDDDAARYLKTADEWAAGVETWCYTMTGPLDAAERERGYYFRINNNKNPNDGFKLEINNGGGVHDERAVVDAGFLELVRLGIKSPDDPKIARSLVVVDKTIRVETPFGPGWYRYNHDGYGERIDGSGWNGSGIGRLWPLLTGERGEYALLRGEDARAHARAMMGFASKTHMMSEQVWDRTWPPNVDWRFGKGTASATPLAWSKAQFIRLVLSIEQNRLIGRPEAVVNHFQKKK